MEEFAKSILWMGIGASITWFFIKKMRHCERRDNDQCFNPNQGYGNIGYEPPPEPVIQGEGFAIHHKHKGDRGDHFHPRMG